MTAPTHPSSPAPTASDAPAGPGGGLVLAALFDNAHFFEGSYEARLRGVLDARCRQAGHHLFLLYGGPLEAPGPTAAADNTIFRTLEPGSVDGVIVVSSMLAAFCGAEPVARLVESFRPTCVCSVGLELPGVPSLVLDNRAGMEAAVEHLVREHGVRRPVFLAGSPNNPEAQARLDAYRAVLERNGIPFDPARVACGHFMPRPGCAAMEALLAACIPFDGVVAANDNMALGAIEALRKWGRRVPRDVPVTGFDDLPLAALGNPPLTTVAQPLDRMANLAVDIVLAQLAGQPVPERTLLPSRFVRRRSCGCEFEPRAPSLPAAVPSSATAACRDRIATLAPRLATALGALPDEAAFVSQRLVASLQLEVEGKGRAFVKGVGALLEDIGHDSQRHAMLHEAIGWLRDELGDLAELGVERAFYEGLDLVAAASTTLQERQRLSLEGSDVTLLGVSEQASVAFDLSSLKQTLGKGLPAAGVRTAFLSCAVPERDGELMPLVSLVDGHVLAAPEPSFPARLLLPPSARRLAPPRTFLVFPLAVDATLMGTVAFDYADGVRGYANFRNEITAVLRNIRLHQELVQKTKLHERSVQERLAATKRTEALGVLAGGVAHDLNNALGPLVALPDLILRNLRDLEVSEAALGKVRADVELIKSASLRAAQTIKDLLTLGRQEHTAKVNLDINRVTRSCVAEASLRLAEERGREIHVTADYADEALGVRGSESQLARAIGNLLANAVDAIDVQGHIAVKTRHEQLTAATARYETIPPGHYAVVLVADDGCGIDALDLGRVFEPFFTRKRPGERSGTGLGLAIVHGVVKEHEGFIDLTSVPGRGTTFALYFPLARLAAEATRPVALGAPSPARILVVDDEAIQLSTCKRVLVELGYQVDTMKSGVVAYHAFQRAAPTGESPYDLVIMDVLLGERLDGFAILERIRRLFPEQKAIVASGHDAHEDSEPTTFVRLPKPYTVDDLARAVAQALAG